MEGKAAPRRERYLTFMAGRGRYGISLDWVCAVQEGASRGSAGEKLLFRERELPLVDMAQWFGAGHEETRFPSLLVIGEGEAVAALKVDSPGMVVSGEEMRDWPALCSEMAEGVFQGVLVLEEGLILVVNAKRICGVATGESDGGSRGGTRE